jgi:hypothetical protein
MPEDKAPPSKEQEHVHWIDVVAAKVAAWPAQKVDHPMQTTPDHWNPTIAAEHDVRMTLSKTRVNYLGISPREVQAMRHHVLCCILCIFVPPNKKWHSHCFMPHFLNALSSAKCHNKISAIQWNHT